MPSTEVARIEPGGYLALSEDPQEIEAIINENLGGQAITEFDLPRVKVPSGGATTWEIPSLMGIDSERTLSGVVVHFKLTRAYWPADADSGTPPACRSNDGINGIGDPGGACGTCPNAEFGSAVDDQGRPAPGQACNAKEIWFMLRPGSYLPIVVALPATSLKAAKAYRVGQLGSAGVRLPSVVTSITLEVAKNGKGDPYAIARPNVAGMLDKDEAQAAVAYAKQMKPIFDAAAAAVAAENGDVAVDGDADEIDELKGGASDGGFDARDDARKAA